MIQTSASVKRVYLEAKVTEPSEMTSLQQATRRELWQWTCYALFSRHAQHRVEQVDIDCNFLFGDATESVRELLAADDPQEILVQAKSNQYQYRGWISASKVFLSPPTPGQSTTDVFEPNAVSSVRVVDSMDLPDETWWRVLLPGSGVAWVPGHAAHRLDHSAVPSGDGRDHGMHLKFVDIVESDQDTILRLLRMVHRRVIGIEIDLSDDTFPPIDGWLTQLLSSCPQLNTLVLPNNIELRRLGDLVASATAGHCRLHRVDLDLALDVDSTDVIEFMGILCDATHPLTKSLQVLKLSVQIQDQSTQDFALHVRRMLACNRRIYSLQLVVYAAEFKLENPGEPVAIRSAPLDIRSKLAFLSAASRHRTGYMDSSVMSIIFSFAAQHRVRTVDIQVET